MAQRFPFNPLADDVEALARLVTSIAEKVRGAPPSSAEPRGAEFVTIDKAAELTGYSKRAIQVKISNGVWLEGRECFKAPDGRRLISMKGYAAWVARGR